MVQYDRKAKTYQLKSSKQRSEESSITNNTDVHGIIFSDTNAVLRHTSVSPTCHHHHNENARHVGTEHHSVVIQRVIRGGVGVSAAVESYHAALQDGGVGWSDGEGCHFRRVW